MLSTRLPDFSHFQVARLPSIHFGPGRIADLVDHIRSFGQRVLIVTGQGSFVSTPRWPALQEQLGNAGLDWHWLQVAGEPSPTLVDAAVQRDQDAGIEVVVGIGGGSVLDAAKAIAGLLPGGRPVMDFLEGVGKGLPFTGPTLPFIAVPTTAGTGSEATKNAVLSVRGTGGFKKSFRHEGLVARVAIIDPELLASCPKGLIAANGMDAFTQLLESYVSIQASPVTDALAWAGMRAFRDGFWLAWQHDHPDQDTGFNRLALASLLSGIALAQAGLGSVHGLASPLGAFFPIPHGEVCGTLLAEATAVNIRALQARGPDAVALGKYAEVGRLLSNDSHLNDDEGCRALQQVLSDWQGRLTLPRLGDYGMTAADIERVVAQARGGSMKTNPLVLTDAELSDLLQARL